MKNSKNTEEGNRKNPTPNLKCSFSACPSFSFRFS